MKFTKMHGLGNDYIYVDCMDGTFGGSERVLPDDDAAIANLSVKLSNRHTGIGADGIIMILPSDCADFRMRIFNADGSEAQMCGNGIRCVAKYVYDNGLTRSRKISVDTLAGVKFITMELDSEGKVANATVDMGTPLLTPEAVPVLSRNGNVDIPVALGDKTINITAISMGNPHGVVFVDALTDEDVLGVGPLLEHHPIFPERANIEFVKVERPGEISMRVWERGSGETMACGTGACASAMASIITGRMEGENRVMVHLLGGDLIITLDSATGHLFMSGPASYVFSGVVDE